MKLSLGQAAKETGLAKSTLSRAIKSGRLSAHRQDGGGYAIDPAELFRVFPPASQAHTPSPVPTAASTEVLVDNRELRLKLDAAAARLRDKEEEVQDLRRRLDLEGEERRKLTMMLLAPHPQEQPRENANSQTIASQQHPTQHPSAHQAATGPALPKKSGVWAWLRGR
jgi:excisionase family DNA binding protein